MKFIFFLFFTSALAFSQQEASIWYFGRNAGVKFNNNGSITALLDGQLNTSEGCASLADSNGNLLFYTDGSTIWNKNHQIMSNGSGLMGNWSTTQSATIVQKPGSVNLFYIFTLDSYAGVNGFRYSIIDMNQDGALGAVTNDKNILIYTPSNEKISVVKHANGTDFWIVTHGWNNNSFYSYLLTSSGLNTTPIISNVGSSTGGVTDNAWGYMKISPNGSKLAISNTLMNLELFDFNINTGQLSNPQTIFGQYTYGVEFSPNSEILYATIPYDNVNSILQFDLNSPNISSSVQVVSNTPFGVIPSGIQMGPNNKIYISQYGESKLGVINNPDIVGAGCNVQLDAVDLAGRKCDLGLPPFVTSFFFSPTIQFNGSCEGEMSNFSINSNLSISNTTWDFGDGTPTQIGMNISHVYANSGNYDVTITINTSQGTISNTRVITIYPKPNINSIISLNQCDDNIDGFSSFNLTEVNSKISANFANETFSYFETVSDAQNNVNPITNFTTYINQVVSNDVVYVRVANINGCFRIAQLNLSVSTTQIPVNFNRNFTSCDDAILGTNIDGVSSFDFSSVTPQIQSLFPVGQQLIISYYRNLQDALGEQNAIFDISNYRNTGYPNSQNIYIRVDSAVNNDCLGLGQHITLNVERIPIVQPQEYRFCDDNQDGQYPFNTTNLQSSLLNGLTNVSVAYYDQNNNILPSPLPNPFVTASQTIRAVVTNNTPTACNYETTIKFIVDDLPEAFPISTTLTTVCDDELNPMNQDGLFAFDTSTFQNSILGNQTGMIVNYFDQNNNPLASPLPNPFITATQNVRVEIVNPNNVNCKAIYNIPFVVHPVPKINLNGNEIVCNELTITKILNAGIEDGTSINDYTYIWKKDGLILSNETNYTLNVNNEGTYAVEVKNAFGCTRTRTINVVASDLATISDIQVSDLSESNSIIVNVTGNGNYVSSLDAINFQESNTFYNLPAGVYTVYVKDLNGCGISQEEVSVLGIPKYFTPNGDGYHDYWNIQGISSKINTKTQIHIFDRFGKLIKQLNPTSQGWDGTYLGQPLPSSDYWYSIKLEDGRDIKGHFTLKR
ncbi:T9SS type B sorting domain-containing protein [Flavobacterium terrae]|uniref:Gliding motility-associated C-terminal domain-containing protein n=1 Tax=Flavobacterium terrae TaxID=415425 RepID=A0A1M6DCV4_9FLAO|nr:T9SS type B sorting domain-containing protein [Flavobacterium terrae]SHI71117.1 gliding motility-associated C-terminal domain-containing protein [Flavobacterium terrae]